MATNALVGLSMTPVDVEWPCRRRRISPGSIVARVPDEITPNQSAAYDKLAAPG
jgi:hypothetical protein